MTKGLELNRRQCNSTIWWNVIHTASGLPVHDPIVMRFDRKRDAQWALDLLLGVDVDWTRPSMKEIAAWGSTDMESVRKALAVISEARAAQDA